MAVEGNSKNSSWDVRLERSFVWKLDPEAHRRKLYKEGSQYTEVRLYGFDDKRLGSCVPFNTYSIEEML